jgi:hypothetical protein
MPLKLSVGLQKKMGLPDYGSLGASCHVECELDSSLINANLDQLQQHVRRAYGVCAQAVNDELARHQTSDSASSANMRTIQAATGNGSRAGDGRPANGNTSRSIRPATQSQVRAIRAIANRKRLDLGQILRNGYSVDSPEALSLTDASQVIDMLKDSVTATARWYIGITTCMTRRRSAT